jgi:diguanylate cyclase (GGDEF)-like protein
VRETFLRGRGDTLRPQHHIDTLAAGVDDGAAAMRLVEAPAPSQGDIERLEARTESYRRLGDVFHDVLSEQSLDALLERIADTLADLVPHDTLTIYEADELKRRLRPVLVRDEWAEKIMSDVVIIGEGITGWAVEHREAVLVQQAQLDPRVKFVPGTPPDPEALISIPLIARESLKGALNVYRLGSDASFTDEEFELAKRFADAAALALDNAHIRARLEHQAQTDSLTGLYNHRYFHERLRAELTRASRSHDPVAVLMLDIDDFKRVNDVHGHGTGDEVLRELAEALRATVRGSDVVCRLGGEEFGVIMPGTAQGSAIGVAERVTATMTTLDFGAAGHITVSLGLAQGPRHAMNPRELIACAEAAMMTAKAHGKNQIVFFDEESSERPKPGERTRDIRSIAHLKMLQSLSGKLNRLNDVREIGTVIANELRSLIDYHNCRVFIVDGDDVIPIAFRGDFAGKEQPTAMEVLRCKVGDGITGRVAMTGESLLVPDAANCEYALQVAGTHKIDESLVAVPLRYGSNVAGVVVMSKLGLHQFDEDDVRLLEVLGGQASVALENARLYEAERREAESAKALLEFSRELAATEGLDEVLSRVVELSAEILASPRASVWLQDPISGELVCRAAWGERAEDILGTRFSAKFTEELAERDEAFILTPEELAGLDDMPQDERHVLVAHMAFDNHRFGCVAAQVEPTDELDRSLRLLEGIAHQAKLALANAGSFESLEQTFISTVEALANALEANDEYTSSHARWITDLAVKVGAGLGLDAKALKRLELGALFHDIGKIGIPGEILTKPGPLTPEERTVIETHPALGARIIEPIERLQEVRAIVRHCHERFDGTGYPDGNAGDEIPLESRIIFVCDAFHAMTTDRPYRKRLPLAEALRRLEAGAGTQFDPEVVAVCVEVLREEEQFAA